MLALTYHGSHDVRVDTVPDPILQEPDDIILKVTATAICGSDLHLYRGTLPGLEDGDILGHEFMGIVANAGPEVTELQKGDRVVVRFSSHAGMLLLRAAAVFSLRDHQSGPGRHFEQEECTFGRGALWLHPSSWRHAWWPGGICKYPKPMWDPSGSPIHFQMTKCSS